MSNSDYQGGLGAGFARARTIQNEYESKIAEWRAHSSKLGRQVAALNERVVIMQADFDANNHVLRLLMDELKDVRPNSQLLIKQNRDAIRQEVFEECMIESGYEVSSPKGFSR